MKGLFMESFISGVLLIKSDEIIYDFQEFWEI